MERSQDRPYLSIVVAARNDDHGGGFMRRFQIFVNGLLAQCERHGLRAELIIVEWNPPGDRPPLSEALSWPERNDFCPVRIITVPSELHNRFKYAKKLPLYQFIAKNVGIRRATGEFILSTCGDLLFSDELVAYLAEKKLRSGFHYRIDRSDVPADVPAEATIQEQLRYCKDNTMRINTKIGTYNLHTRQYYGTYSVIDLELTNLHFNACGDFTLMSRDDWFRIKGHPEMDAFSLHIDSLTLLVAHYSGIRQVVLEEPLRLYHIEHGFSAVPEQIRHVDRIIKKTEIPGLTLLELQQMASEMSRKGSPIIINDDSWGLSVERLEETLIQSGRVQKKESRAVTDTGEIIERVSKEIAGDETLLVINEYPPLYDIKEDDEELLQFIKGLTRRYRVVYLSRYRPNSEKYTETLRKLGVIFFYDKEGLGEQYTPDTRFNMRCAAPVDFRELLEHQVFKTIVFGSADMARTYMARVGDISPGSKVIVKALDIKDKELKDDLLIYGMADWVITDHKGAEILRKDNDSFDLFSPEEASADQLLAVVQSLGLSIVRHRGKDRSRLFMIEPTEGLYPEISLAPEALIFFTYNDDSESARLSLETLFRHTDVNKNLIILALPERFKDLSQRLEKQLRYYFVYKDMNELSTAIYRIASHYRPEYLLTVDSTVLVTPDWLNRLVRHFLMDEKVGIVFPRGSDILYNSRYQLEKHAWKNYIKFKGQEREVKKIEVPCLAFRGSLISESNGGDIRRVVEESRMRGYKTVKAMDTLVLHAEQGRRQPTETIEFERPVTKQLSVIIPVLKREGLIDCLQSLFNQKEIDYRNMEIILVSSNNREETDKILKAMNPPCTLRHFHLKGGNRSMLTNTGIRKSSGSYILLFSDSAVAEDSLIYQHLKAHRDASKRYVAILGRIFTSLPDNPTPFMRFLSRRPSLPCISRLFYNYDIEDLDKPEGLSSSYFYSANISVRRELLKDAGLFDEDLSQGVEDSEFGYRVVALKGCYINYNQHAISTLRADISLEDFLESQYLYGRDMAVLFKKHPDPERDIRRLKRWSIRHLMGREAVIERAKEIIEALEKLPEELRKRYTFGRGSLLERCYFILSQYHFYMGVDEALKQHEGEEWLQRYLKEIPLGIDTTSENMAESLMLKGFFDLARGDYNSAMEGLNNSFGLTISPFAYYIAGLLYLDMEEFRQAESVLEEGIKRLTTLGNNPEVIPFILPAGDAVMYYIWLAMSCIPQGKYEKAAKVLEDAIEERIPISMEQAGLLYRCLSVCYRKLDMGKKAVFCAREYERLTGELQDDNTKAAAYR